MPRPPAHNLPSRLTSFVGREREIAEITALLEAERLITLAGAPGVGKTRLSLQMAARVLDRFPHGVWLVELAPLTDPALAPQAVAQVLDVREQPGRALTTTLAEYLRTRRLLLVLDNCEHLIGAAAVLVETLVRACPDLHVLATSREPLAIEGEVTYRVPSLGVAEAESEAESEAARLFLERAHAAAPSFQVTERSSPIVAQICARLDGIPLAIELAAARVRALSVEQIAARLDDRFHLLTGGSRTALPRQQTLRGAVDWSYCDLTHNFAATARLWFQRRSEWAVGRLLCFAARNSRQGCGSNGASRQAYAPSAGAEGLLEVQKGSPSGASSGKPMVPTRQTYASSHSYDLLSEPEQALLRRLAIFAGGFTLDAAEQMGTLDLLTSLVDKSLVQVDEGDDGERRYRLLETFRQYGLEKLIEHGELAEARDRHRDYFLALAEGVAPALNERADSTLLTRLEREHDNLRAALGWCLDEPGTGRDGPTADEDDQRSSRAALGVRLAAAIWRFWWLRGHLGEGRRWLARSLAAPSTDASPAVLAARDLALLGLANLSAYQGDYRAAVAHMTEKLAFCRETGNHRGVVVALHRLGFYVMHLGELERGARLCEESVALGRQLAHPPTLAGALHTSGIVWYVLGRFEQSVALSAEAIGLFREIGNVNPIAYALRSQSRATADLGDPVKATRLAEEGLHISQEVGDRRGIIESYKDLGRFALLTGDVDRAIGLLSMGLTICQQMEDRWLATICITILAGVKIAQGIRTPRHGTAGRPPVDGAREHLLDAARLFGMAERLRDPGGLDLPSDVQTTYDRDLALLRERLGGSVFTQAWAEGRATSFEQAVKYALAITAPPELIAPDAADPSSGLNGDPSVARLTPREREVSALIVQGRTNREIAEALVLSERTVDSHVRNIMGKLEVSSRARIAAWAVQHGLDEPR